MPGKQWTQDEIKMVNKLAAEGWSNTDIGAALNRTPQAVANKKISIRDPGYYLRAQAKADEAEAYAMNEEEKMKQPDYEAVFIALMGMTVFGILAIGAYLNAGSGL